MPSHSPVRYATALARDAAFVSVGFGVLGFQRLQVRRRELEARLAAGDPDGPLEEALAVVEHGASVGCSVLGRLVHASDD
jgi:hypothetical protein